MRLTDLSIRQMPFTTQGQQRVRDDALPGFGLTVGTRTKTFFVMFGTDRRLRTLGQWPQTSLKDARQAARAILLTPPPKTRLTRLSELLDAFIADCTLRLRPSTVRRYQVVFREAPAIKLEDVPRSLAKTPHEIAAYKAAFNFGLRNDLVLKNPFHLSPARFAVRDRVLSDDEIRKIWQHLDHPYSTIIRLLILTGQRRGQFQRFNNAWVGEDSVTFPGSIMKSRRPHTIPLSEETRALILTLLPFNGWGKSKARLDTATGVTGWVHHDLRRYYSTTMARIGTPLHVTEQLLDHRSTISGVAAIYNRHSFLTEARTAQLAYEAHIRQIVAP